MTDTAYRPTTWRERVEDAGAAIGDWAKRARPRVLVPLVDMVVLSYLWTVGTAFFGFLLYGKEVYVLLPWWWMGVAVVAGAALWESVGVSPGMRALGVRILRGDGTAPSVGDRLRYFVGWPLWPLGVLTSMFDPQGRSPQERAGQVAYTPVKAPPRPWYRTSVGWAVALIAVFTLGVAFGVTKVNLVALVTRAHRTGKFWRQVFSPDLSLLGRGVQLLFETLFMALVATLFAIPVAGALSFLAARNLMRGPLPRLVYTVLRVMGSFTRSVDAVIWAIIFALWVGMGSFAGALALWIHSIVDLMKLYAEQLESIDPGPVEAVTATGANRLQVIRYGVIPQIVNPYISFTLYRWDINVRMATVVGLVGGGGIGLRLSEYLRAWAFAEASMLMILVVILVWVIDYLSARLRAKLA